MQQRRDYCGIITLMSNETIRAWHEFVSTKNSAAFSDTLDDEVSFHSPVVHTPQKGKKITLLYLEAAHDVLSNDSFQYEHELIDKDFAVLEFTADIKGVHINGVDMIRWNETGKIVEFKVMIRPLQAINMIHQEMAARLQRHA